MPSLRNDSNFDLDFYSENHTPIGQKNHGKNIAIELEAQDAEFEDVVECITCGRKFKPIAHTKHVKTCQKFTAQQKAKDKAGRT